MPISTNANYNNDDDDVMITISPSFAIFLPFYARKLRSGVFEPPFGRLGGMVRASFIPGYLYLIGKRVIDL